MIPVVFVPSTLPEDADLPDNLFILPYFDGLSGNASESGGTALGVNDGDTVKSLIHVSEITEGSIKSMHLIDDTTDYQNTSGNVAMATLALQGAGLGTEVRHVKVYSSGTTDATGTLVWETGDVNTLGILDAANELLRTPPLPIQNNHYVVVENVDDGRGGVNNVFVTVDSAVVERI